MSSPHWQQQGRDLFLTLRRCLGTMVRQAEVAQVVEHGTENAGVASSTLALGTFWLLKSGSGSVVEHLLAKERVVGSNPIFRSTKLGVK